MTRFEQMGKLRERLIKKRDEVFEAYRLSDEARLVLSEHDIEPEETAQKGAIVDVMAILDEKEQKDIQAINRALARKPSTIDAAIAYFTFRLFFTDLTPPTSSAVLICFEGSLSRQLFCDV